MQLVFHHFKLLFVLFLYFRENLTVQRLLPVFYIFELFEIRKKQASFL